MKRPDSIFGAKPPGWCAAWVRCRLCGHEHASIYPEDIVDECRQECLNCGHMACEPVAKEDADA